MRRRRWLAGFLLVGLAVAGLYLTFGQQVQEIQKGHDASNDGKRAVAQLKKGKTVTVGSEHAETAVQIPSVGINLAIFKTREGLNYGAYAELTAMNPNTSPGNPNYVLAGHSSYIDGVLFQPLFKLTTKRGYVVRDGAPDRHGDYQGGSGSNKILVYTRYAKYTYQADVAYTVNGDDSSILSDPMPGQPKMIHLFTCPRTNFEHPPWRYVVQGHLTNVEPTKLGLETGVDTTLVTK